MTKINSDQKKSTTVPLTNKILKQIANLDELFLTEIDLTSKTAKKFHKELYAMTDEEFKRTFMKIMLYELNRTSNRGGKKWMRILKNMYYLYQIEYETTAEKEKQIAINKFLEM